MAKAIQLDFTNVKDGGNFNKKHQAPGDYKAKVVKVDDVAKKDDPSVKMWLFTIQVGTGTYPYYCTYTAENQLWKIRNLFVAAGINIPKKRMAVDPNKVVGKAIGVTLEDEEYEGKMQSVVQSTFPTSELEGDGGSDEADDDEGEAELEEVDTPQAEEKPKKKAKDVEAPQEGKKDKKKKDKKKDSVSDKELEELEIEDI